MTTLLLITGLALLAVAVSLWRAGWRGDFGTDRTTGMMIGMLSGVATVGAVAAITVAIGGG